MNRQQAEHILDAYTMMARASMESQEEADAKHVLREVILDAMTEYRSNQSSNWPGIGITYPSTDKPLVTYTNYPENWDWSPKATCTGVDPLFKQQTTEVGK